MLCAAILEKNDSERWKAYFDRSLDVVVLQYKGLLRENGILNCWDNKGGLVQSKQLAAGSTVVFLESSSWLSGQYYLECRSGENRTVLKVHIMR